MTMQRSSCFMIGLLAAALTACRQQPTPKIKSALPNTVKEKKLTLANVSPDTADTAINDYYNIHQYMVNMAPDSDVQTIEEKAVVFISPDSSQIETMKKESGEDDFYTTADDNMYYQYEAGEYLKKKPVLLIYAQKRYLKFIGRHQCYLIDTKAKASSGWFTLFFRPDSLPRIPDVTAPDEAYRDYFNKNTPVIRH